MLIRGIRSPESCQDTLTPIMPTPGHRAELCSCSLHTRVKKRFWAGQEQTTQITLPPPPKSHETEVASSYFLTADNTNISLVGKG